MEERLSQFKLLKSAFPSVYTCSSRIALVLPRHGWTICEWDSHTGRWKAVACDRAGSHGEADVLIEKLIRDSILQKEAV